MNFATGRQAARSALEVPAPRNIPPELGRIPPELIDIPPELLVIPPELNIKPQELTSRVGEANLQSHRSSLRSSTLFQPRSMRKAAVFSPRLDAERANPIRLSEVLVQQAANSQFLWLAESFLSSVTHEISRGKPARPGIDDTIAGKTYSQGRPASKSTLLGRTL